MSDYKYESSGADGEVGCVAVARAGMYVAIGETDVNGYDKRPILSPRQHYSDFWAQVRSGSFDFHRLTTSWLRCSPVTLKCIWVSRTPDNVVMVWDVGQPKGVNELKRYSQSAWQSFTKAVKDNRMRKH